MSELSGVGNELLKKKYNLHKSPEVEAAAKRYQDRTGERIPQNPHDRIQNYLNRFHEITDRENPADREHGINAIKRLLYRRYIIKPEEIPESYWENQRRIIRERGQAADLEHIDWEEVKQQNAEAVIADQRVSLDKWIDYLSSPDAPYADAFKYWTLRSVLNMGEYDKEKKQYPQRSTGTTKPFPDLNREALAYVLDAVAKKYIFTRSQAQQQAADPEFEKILQGENFSKLYAWAIEKVTPANAENLANIQGQWVKYNQGSDHMPLVTSLQGHGTGWCTAGESIAETQLQGGDFYVYYSNDQDGKPTVPRVAIRMEGSSIAEVRGIATDQNLDSYIGPIVEQKLEEFPDGKLYQKKVADMKMLTAIEQKTQAGTPLDTSDLTFLYEIESSIQGFGYSRDPRIKEIISLRNRRGDLSHVIGCEPTQIASSPEDLQPNTKAYVGSLVPGIFTRLQDYHIEYIYTPEGKISIRAVEVGEEAEDQLHDMLMKENVFLDSFSTRDMLKYPKFSTSTKRTVNTVRLKVGDLGFNTATSVNQLYAKAQELGLTLCPAEVAPRYALQYKNDFAENRVYIGMKLYNDLGGEHRILDIVPKNGELYVGSVGFNIDDTFLEPGYEFIFSLDNKTQTTQSRGLFSRFFKR